MGDINTFLNISTRKGREIISERNYVLLCKKTEVKDEKGLISINLVMGNRDHSYLVVSIKYETECRLEIERKGIKNTAQKL